MTCNSSRFHWVIAAALLLLAQEGRAQEAPLQIDWIERQITLPPVLSNMPAPPQTQGLDGAELSLTDVATTGKFAPKGMQIQRYALRQTIVAPQDEFLPRATLALRNGAQLIIARAPHDELLALADLAAKIAPDAMIFNVSAEDVDLRDTNCRANLLHTTPSRDMLTDALAQFLTLRRWTDLAMISTQAPRDVALANAMKASLTKFGLSLEAEKPWAYDADMRRAAASEAPVFTQDLPDHDVLLVADEAGDYARYLAYNTWDARPLALSEGLQPVGWAGVVEQHGAAQLQNRFRDRFAREMSREDYAAWAAIASIAEAVTRTKSTDPAALRAYMLSPDFRLAGFLGAPLSFRAWNGQLRQPIPLVTDRAVAALAPIDGFLHQSNTLDTLGLDSPESQCTAFGGPK